VWWYNQTAGYIRSNGDIAISFRYEDAGVFSEGLAPVKVAGKWLYIDEQGRERITWKE